MAPSSSGCVACLLYDIDIMPALNLRKKLEEMKKMTCPVLMVHVIRDVMVSDISRAFYEGSNIASLAPFPMAADVCM